jgi:hypothetical protein
MMRIFEVLLKNFNVNRQYLGNKSLINNNNNSIHVNVYLLPCRLNSTSACYKTSIKTQIKHRILQIHKNKILNEQNKNIAEKKE